MKDRHDSATIDFFEQQQAPTPRKKVGRPRKADAKSGAQRTREFRAREQARLAALKDLTQPVSSAIIDLSALPPWQRA